MKKKLLPLNIETIRQLNASDLGAVQGASNCTTNGTCAPGTWVKPA